ncbi:HWE histidine kinase domain-containing protein [Sphingomicrobium clamense]|uniref:histidine kinase n=1 Tax=Sphingomicrobium clamense TaxID=2851013 RepID=A0ABS6V676_9SPHN|nr:HWE histidine kinase domain-containing protein [Sphingomicrobium sp. B8]MBW0144697.1 GAF domain-containing protein [Sphingomicrobium sp. B8]
MNEHSDDFQVDLTNCDREPIHLLGAIQPIGFLVALSSDWMVQCVSANISEYFDAAPDGVIGENAQELFSGEAIHALRNRLALLRGPDDVERLFAIPLVENGQPFDVAIHMIDGTIVVEGEPARERDHGDAMSTVRGMIGRLDKTEDVESFYREGARQVRALTGFDRVMIYQFDEDGSGEVVAEAAKSGIGSFLGMHYPASDIPKQARELYQRNLLRMIVDVSANTVAIVPQKNAEGKPLDLSLSVLRAVSPIHIEYLKNMGVTASMSISLIVDGKFWGLIACHHYSGPRCPAFERRAVCELFAQMFAMRIESRQRQEMVDYERRARDVSDHLLGSVASDESLLNDPQWLSQILTSAIPADGVGVFINGNQALSGHTPDAKQFEAIVRMLNTTARGKVYATDHIASLVPDAVDHADTAAGLLAIPISRTPRDYVVLFREERIRSVRWGGDPHKPVSYGPNGARLTPRESFAEWKELVEGKSAPFTPSETRVAETLRATLIEVVLRLADEANQERKAANDRQELLIAELNHRVRNILSLIRGLIRQAKPTEETSIEDFVAQIDGRVHALARAHNQITDDHWGPAPLKGLIDAEVAAFLVHQKDRLTTSGPNVLLKPQAYSTMALVIHELVTNSAKYGSLSDSGCVEVDWRIDNNGDLVIDWQEKEGPVVVKPSRQGFGTTIIEHSVPYDLGGSSDLNYRKEGFWACFRIPARHLSVDEERKMEPVPEAAVISDEGHKLREPVVDDIFKDKTLLLVEDSLIISLDAEDIVMRLGADRVVTEGTVAGALATLEREEIDFALLDINLGDQNSYPVADELEKRGTPFVFATGYGEQAQLPDKHCDRLVLQKPYTIASVSKRVSEWLNR